MRYVILPVISVLALVSAAWAQPVPGRQPQTMDAQLRVPTPLPPATYVPPRYPDYVPALVSDDPIGGEADYVAPEGDMVQTQNGISYATGGVGEEEEAALKSLSGQFNLKLLNTLAGGQYVGEYTVRITDGGGNLALEAPGDGPYFYVALPGGAYAVEIVRNGMTQRQKVIVAKGVKALQFRWSGE